MTHAARRSASGFTIIIVMAVLSWFTLACGLFGGDRQDAAPTPEPDISATISAALRNSAATREAATSPAAPTPQPVASPMPEPTATPAPAGAAPAAEAGDLASALHAVGPDSRWRELFSAFSDSEQSCIRDALGEERLALGMDSPIYQEGEIEEWQVTMLGCLAQESAAALFYSLLIVPMTQGQGVELSEEDAACIQALLAGADVSALAAGSRSDATPQQAEAFFGFFFGLAACVPEAMAAGGGVGGGVGAGAGCVPAVDLCRRRMDGRRARSGR